MDIHRSPFRRGVLAAVFTAGTVGAVVPVHAAQDAADARLARDLAASCAACHGTGGRSAGGIASLAGRDRATIVEQLKAFRAGTRPATVMHQHAKGYSDDEFERLADYFSQQVPADR